MKELNTSETDKLVGGFIIGCAFMAIVVILLFGLITNSDEKIVIRSSKKIIPEWQLTTDGKKVDTVYIYKQIQGR